MAASGVTSYRAQKAREKAGDQLEEPNEWELGEIRVPGSLIRGTPLTKFSEKKGKAPKERLFRLDADQGRILWDSKRRGVINIENIKELRLGPSAHSEMALLLPQQEMSAFEDRWLTIIYTIEDSYKTLHVIAPTADILNQWYTTLSQLRQLRLDFMAGILQSTNQGSEVWNRHHFAGADKSGDQRLSFSEVKVLCRRLNLGQKESEIKRRFDEADGEHNKTLSYEEFRSFVAKLKERSELRQIFDEIKAKGDFTYTVFETFMKNTQKSTLSPKELQDIYQQFIPTPSSQPSGTQSANVKASAWSLESFTAFLNSGYNSVFSDWVTPPPSSQGAAVPPPSQKTYVYQDMTQPLSSYFICSSHNTYLIGNQLVGTASVEGYVRALLGGCRSVEMDLYDGPEPGLGGAFSVTVSNTISTEVGDLEEKVEEAVEAAEEAVESGNILNVGTEQPGVATYKGIIPGEPIVTHGGTLTSSLSVRHICEAIERYAFVASPYPVIISGELHLSIPQQKVLVKVMREVFGDKLVVAPIDGDDVDIILPSPEELKGRILLKAKNKIIESESKNKIEDEEDHEEVVHEPKEVREKATGEEEKETWGGEIRSVGKKMGQMFGFGKRHEKSTERATETKPADHSSKEEHTTTAAASTPAPVLSKTAPPATTSTPVVVTATTTVTASPRPPASPQLHVQTTLVQETKESADATQTGSAHTPVGKQLMAPELVPLLVYTSGVSFRGLSPNAGYAPSQVFSLSENRAKSLIHNPKQAEVKDSLKSSARDSALLVEHTREHLVRVYPKGTRVDSSNYEPNVFWAVGCQLVTLNWQTVDRGWHLNRAMYLRNGGSGYVLKPSALLDPSYPFDHQQHHRTKHVLRIRVISAQQLPRPKDSQGHEVVDKNTVDPYVKVTVHIPMWASGQSSESIAPVSLNRANSSASARRLGRSSTPIPGEVTSTSSKQEGVLTESGPTGDEQAGAAVGEREVKAKTKTIPNNGFNPIWNEELKLPFDVFGEGMKDLIFVRFLVKSSKLDRDDFVGGYNTSLGSLELGYRHLPLYDEQVSQILFASLFVHISIEDL